MIQIYEGVGYWGGPLGWVGWRRGGITTFPLLLITLSFYCDNKGYSFGIFGVLEDFRPSHLLDSSIEALEIKSTHFSVFFSFLITSMTAQHKDRAPIQEGWKTNW